MYAAVSKLLPVILRFKSGTLVMIKEEEKKIYVKCPVCGYAKWVEMDSSDSVECPNDCLLTVQDYEDLLLKTKTEILTAEATKEFYLRQNSFGPYYYWKEDRPYWNDENNFCYSAN